MIESTKFWFTHFARIQTQDEQLENNTDYVSGLDAALLLIDTAFPNRHVNWVKNFLIENTEPENSDLPAFLLSDIEFMSSEFANSDIQPGVFDITAIVFETLGRVFKENTPISSMLEGQQKYFESIRLLYPSFKLALSVQASYSYILEEVENCIQRIEKEEQTKRRAIAENTRSEIQAATKGALRDIDELSATVIERIGLEGTKMLDQKKEELVDNLILQDVMELWDEKTHHHQKWFRSGAGLFVLLIVFPIGMGLYNFEQVSAVVKSMLPAGNNLPWGSLLIFTLPALGYAWILRLVSRFTLQNLTLADDAAQRSVMAKTFIRLAAEEKVHDEKDRAIMLNALFRPIPGAKEQDLQPPTLADFINKQS